MTFKLGTSNDERTGGYVKKNIWSLKDGSNVYRILPPMFSLADEGKWSKFYRVEYGYKNGQGHQKPFLDVREVNYKTKMVEVESEAHVRRESLKAQLQKLKDSGAPQESIKKMADIVMQFNQDSKHHLNVINQKGEIGLLKIPHRAKEALDAVIKKLGADGVDPRSVDNGRFFVFERSGTGLNTLHTVSVFKEKIEVPGIGIVEKDVVHKLDSGIIARLPKEAFDLDKMYMRLTPEEVSFVVKGGPDAMDKVLASKEEAKPAKPLDVSHLEEDEDFEAEAEAHFQAQINAESAPVVEAPKPVLAAPKPAPSAAAMSDEDFLASLA